MKLYSFKGEYIKEVYEHIPNLTGIVEWADESKVWFMNGKLHRLDGPAYEGSDGIKEWYIDGKRVSEEQCKLLCSIIKLKGLI